MESLPAGALAVEVNLLEAVLTLVAAGRLAHTSVSTNWSRFRE
jgi:hypothetical protein